MPRPWPTIRRPARPWPPTAEIRARALFRAERYAEAIPWADRALALAEPLRLDFVVAMALDHQGDEPDLPRSADGRVSPCSTAPTWTRAPTASTSRRSGPGSTSPRPSATPTPGSPSQWTRKRHGPGPPARRVRVRHLPREQPRAAAIRTGEWTWMERGRRGAPRVAPGPGRDPLDRGHGPPARRLAAGSTWPDDPRRWSETDEAAADPQAARERPRPGASRRRSRARTSRPPTGSASGCLEHEFAGPRDPLLGGPGGPPRRRPGDGGAGRSDSSNRASGGAGDGDVAALRAGLAALDGRADDALAALPHGAGRSTARWACASTSR